MFSHLFETPLGTMMATGNEEALFFLGFANKAEMPFPEKMTSPIVSIKRELKAYFDGKSNVFQTPIRFEATPFQSQVWSALRSIPFGKTKSYKELAIAIGNPSAARAVGNANGLNPFAILVPCHRVIQADGTLGGYSAGLDKKQWLLRHEGLAIG